MIWIALIVYKTGIVHQLTNSTIVANDTEALEQIIKQEVFLYSGGGCGGGGSLTTGLHSDLDSFDCLQDWYCSSTHQLDHSGQ